MVGYIPLMLRIEGALARKLASVSKRCARKPKTTTAIFFLLAIALTAGMLTADIESDGEKLWVDQNSLPMQNRNFVYSVFDPPARQNTLFITAKTTGDNVLTMDAITEIFEIHSEMVAARTTSNLTLENLCALNAAETCTLGGPLQFWDFDLATFTSQETSDESVQETCTQDAYPNGGSVVRQIDFGAYRVNGLRANAAVLRVAYDLVPISEDGTNTEQFAWEDLFLEIAFRPRTHVNVFPFAQKSIDEELEKSVFNDIILMAIAYVTMIVFASLTLGRPCGARRGRALLATTDVFVIIFSAGAGYGIAALAGVPFTSLAQVLPFILVGIGIDNAYVISASFDRTDASLPHPERIYEAVLEAGMSITVTSLTDIFAFVLASATKLPALQWFGQYAALAVLCIYTAHITVFPALLTLDTRRYESNRRDIVPCVRITPATVNDPKESTSESTNVEPKGKRASPTLLETGFGVLASILLRPVVKVFVIITFLGMGAVGAWQATGLENSFDLRMITPDDSYLMDFYDVSETYFGTVTGFSPVGFYIRDVDFSNATVQANVRSLSDEIFNSEVVDAAKGRLDWHLIFTEWAQAHTTWNASLSPEGFVVGSNFVPALQEFLAVPVFLELRSDFVWNGDDTEVEVARMWFFENASDVTEDNINVLNRAEAITSSGPLAGHAFLSSVNFLTYDQYRIIKDETLSSLLYALVAVVAVTLVLLVHPLMVVICVITVALVFACILGSLLLFWKISLNAVSCINLLMAISLVVDFCIHIMVTFGHQDPALSRNDRVHATLCTIGPSVFLAISTTFLGILPLAAATSEIFRVFFKSFVSIVLFGGSYGLIFLPVLLSLVGPTIPRGEASSTAIAKPSQHVSPSVETSENAKKAPEVALT